MERSPLPNWIEIDKAKFTGKITSLPARADIAADIDEQLIPDAQVTWTSSRDGPIGSGRLLSRRNLTSGTHVLTVRGTDSGGLFAERSVTITVQPRIYNNGNIDGEGVVGSTDIVSLLSDWGLTGLGDMDLDGVVGASDIANLLQRWGT